MNNVPCYRIDVFSRPSNMTIDIHVVFPSAAVDMEFATVTEKEIGYRYNFSRLEFCK
jgi:hypothetical protein